MHKTLMALVFSLSVSGCVTVVDAVSDEPVQPDIGKRSFGAYWDDKQLRTIVTVNLKKTNPEFAKLNIDVYSYNGVILITGQVPTAELRKTATEVASDVSRVRQVYNELQIGPKRGFRANSHDVWLKSKIKSKLIANTDIDSGRVEVIVEDHVVYLMGLLSHAQTEKITDVVRKQKGVNKVIRAIEYID